MLLMRLGTTDGITTLCRQGDRWIFKERQFTGADVNVLVHHPVNPNIIYAGTYGDGLHKSDDAAEHWHKLPLNAEYIRSIAFDPTQPRTLYVGTEPANLYRSDDGGDTWKDLAIRRLPGSSQWALPYSPRSGALRSLVLHPLRPGLIYGGVEQAGVIKSTDAGETWSISREDVDKDVHWLSAHPEKPDCLFAATGEGTFVTRDGGAEWQRLFEDYTRAVLVHPIQPKLIFSGPARDVGEGGSILASFDGGSTWRARAHNGVQFPLRDMVELFVVHPKLPELVFAILSEGGVLWSGTETLAWHPFEPKQISVQCLDLCEI